MDPSSDSELHSPNAMQVDTDEYVVEPPESEKDDVVNINPDQLNGDATERVSELPLADNYEAMKELVQLPIPDDPEIIADVVHTWHIENWMSLTRKEHGPIFEAGGIPWRVLMFPAGNNVDYCSFYLELGFADSKPPTDDWYCCAQFGLVLWNPNDPSLYQHHTAHHRFTREEGDWGFTRFVELRKLFNVEWKASGRPLVENEAVNMTAYVRIVKDETGVLWHTFTNYDSKKETGYAVYQIPTQNEENLSNSAYTLQRLFYQLQTSNTAVSTNELTKSFGWETRHIFEQQDVQELSRKLMERMEEKMKGTDAQNVLPDLFCGKVKTYISCINVDYESSRVEDFWDIQLNVSGNKNIEESFKDYIQVEKMDGENQYFAGDEFKLQDANKGVIFQSFPEVLHLQLKRFEYDIERDAMMKINDRYEFPETFDAAPYLSDDADKSESYIYQLHGVLVHSGDLNAGHYYAFIKPEKSGYFYKYDDDRVIRARMREVLEENFGGESQHNGQTKGPFQKTQPLRQNSAYMLVYIRQSRLDKVLPPVSQEDTPPHLQKKLDEEAALKEARRKEREEQHLYLNARVVTDEIYREHSGTDLASFESPDKDSKVAKSYRVLKSSTIQDLVHRVSEDIGQDPRKVRLWCMVNRQNKTIRPDQPMLELNQTIEEANMKLAGSKQLEFRVWAEVAEEVDDNGDAVWPVLMSQQPGTSPLRQPSQKTDNIMLLLKWFDIDSQLLRGAGHIYIGKEKKVEDLVPPILKKMGWPEKSPSGERTQLKLFEEIKPQMIDSMKAKQTLKAAELQDGDIICFQKVPDSKIVDTDKESIKSGRSFSSLMSSQTTLTSQSSQTTLTSQSNGGSSIPISSQNHSSVSMYSALPPKTTDRIEEAPQFYDYLLHRKVIHLMPHPRSTVMHDSHAEPIDVEMSSKSTYDQITAKVGERLNVDPTHLRLHTVNSATGNPKAPVKRNLNQTLQQILTPPYTTYGNPTQRQDELYFEILDMSLSELDTKKNLKVTWLSEGITKDDMYDILVPKNGNVADLVAGLVKKAQIDDESKGGPIRVYETHNNRVYKELVREHSVLGITDYVSLFAERIPEEEINADPRDFISVFHFQGEPNKPHGIPFRFLIKQEEKFSDTKKRLEKRTGIKGKNFEKIKFAVVKRASYSKPTYLADDDIIWEVAASEEDLLGMDHVDRSRMARNGGGDLFLK